MRAGTYYIGDLCYVLKTSNSVKISVDWNWSKVCDIMDLGEGKHYYEDIPFAYLQTYFGDGEYYDQKSRRYLVDSGTIGCIETKYLDRTILDEVISGNYGQIQVFEDYFKVYSSGLGSLFFGDVMIDTHEDDDIEEEYEEYDDS